MTLSPSTSSSTTAKENNNHDSVILSKFLDDSYIRNQVDQIKSDDDYLNQMEMKMSDKRRGAILNIAEFMEHELTENGCSILISEISTYITRIFERRGLEKHCYLILEVLDDKYKNKAKDHYAKNQSKVLGNFVRRRYDDISNINLKLMDADTIRDLRTKSIMINDALETELLERQEPMEIAPLAGFDEFKHLDEIEKNKFKKASIGAPLSTAEQLCQDPIYARGFEELKKIMQQAIDGHIKMKKWFTEEYPPLTSADVIELTDCFKTWNEMMRPYYDRKYRRDHIQLAKIGYNRAIHTSTKASHDSQIPSAHHLDKNGLPVMRGLTKEQIDAVYEWEINFIQKLINTYLHFMEKISNINAKHGGRCMEDRALDLSSTLSHHA